MEDFARGWGAETDQQPLLLEVHEKTRQKWDTCETVLETAYSLIDIAEKVRHLWDESETEAGQFRDDGANFPMLPKNQSNQEN